MKTLLILLITSLAVSAQTFSVTDNSPSDSPITFGGSFTVAPGNGANNVCSLVGRNSSSKTAVAWRFDIEIASPQGVIPGYMRHDTFFTDKNVAVVLAAKPNSDFDPSIDIPCVVLAGALSSKTLWVQFSDGSTWGDSAAGAYMMTERTNAIGFVSDLKAAYSAGGEAGFEQALASYRHHGSSTQETLLRDEAYTTKLRLLKMKTVPAQLAEIKRMLAVADARRGWLK